jgi:hypothetical protein
MDWSKIFKSVVESAISSTSPVNPASPVKTGILHPEEPRNDSQTVANTNIDYVMTRWLTDWKVPAEHWDHWRAAIVIKIYDSWPPDMLARGIQPDTPAATWEDKGKRYLVSLSRWLNPGVIAHEQAHNSYALMAPAQKSAFSATYTSLKNSDPLIKYLYSINRYGLSSDIEGHAEVYRYLGETMPAALKGYYPKLM